MGISHSCHFRGMSVSWGKWEPGPHTSSASSKIKPALPGPKLPAHDASKPPHIMGVMQSMLVMTHCTLLLIPRWAGSFSINSSVSLD